jgi:uncharacterized protein YecE (DUF72 family)
MDFSYAVEVRHRDYFDSAGTEAALDRLLTELGIDRVLFDSRPLYSAPPVTDAEKLSQTRKPRSPFRKTVTGRRPLVRIVGRDNVEQTLPWLMEWSGIVAGWIREGLEPYVFTHAPNDAFAPELAESFHFLLREQIPEIPPLPTWAGRAEKPAPRQQMLF